MTLTNARKMPGLLLIALVWCGCGGSQKAEKAEAETVTPVQVAKASRESIQRVITAEAILFPVTQSSVTAKISAPVREFRVNRGDHVRQGQVLAVLENRDLGASVQDNNGL